MRSELSGQHGFTMIEAVVALAVVAIGLAAIGTLVASNFRGSRVLKQHFEMSEVARTVAAELPRAGASFAPELAGNIAGHRWQIRVSAVGSDLIPLPDARFVPRRVEVRVRSPSGAMLSLETIRLQPREGQ